MLPTQGGGEADEASRVLLGDQKGRLHFLAQAHQIVHYMVHYIVHT